MRRARPLQHDWATARELGVRQRRRIRALLREDRTLRQEFDSCLAALRRNLGPAMSSAQAVELLSQHLVTRPVFDALFAGHALAARNSVAGILDRAATAFERAELCAEAKELDDFYDGVRRMVAAAAGAADKQALIKRLYQGYFAGATQATSERDGIVYTPSELVGFILRSVERVLRTEFGQSLGDRDVGILDPFTGTGTFIVELLRSGLMRPDAITRKYRGHEIWANEINPLAHYVAAANIEEAYLDVVGGEYTPFPGIVLADTFRLSEGDRAAAARAGMSVNDERAARQRESQLTVILGNPPYSVGRRSANDDNENPRYQQLDERIAATYAARSTTRLKNSLYDSYLRALRWASDRIGDRGVIAFVTNGGFIDGRAAAGVRRSLVAEFSSLYIYNLRGDQRCSGEDSRREGGKIFGAGSRATVAIVVLVKNPGGTTPGVLRYRDIGDYLSRDEKLAALRGADIGTVEWRTLRPDADGDWINQRDRSFAGFPGLEAEGGGLSFFTQASNGVATNRDAWAYSSSATALASNMSRTVAAYSALVEGREAALGPSVINWSAGLRADLRRGRRVAFSPTAIRESTYRPFTRQFVYLDPVFNERQGKLATLYPEAGVANPTIVVTGKSSHCRFAALAVDGVHDLHTLDTGKAFPRYTFRQAGSGYERIDNVTDGVLAAYRRRYGGEVTKDAVFDFVYGLLHSPEYRERHASALKKALPRLPGPRTARDFWAFARAGAELAALHLGYESVEPHPLTVSSRSGRGRVGTEELRVERMTYAGKLGAWDKTVVVYNQHLTVSGIPLDAQDYVLGSRSALDWVIERYRVRIDRASGIRNDPNDWGVEHGDPRYILDLLARIVTVSLRTVHIVRDLPSLYTAPARAPSPYLARRQAT